jgi:hypothetical protein
MYPFINIIMKGYGVLSSLDVFEFGGGGAQK